ncbi:MAG: hypothetical protein ACOYXY_08985 [Thermodesulfobacteriota bacterium]
MALRLRAFHVHRFRELAAPSGLHRTNMGIALTAFRSTWYRLAAIS